jgi:hypothetical protein
VVPADLIVMITLLLLYALSVVNPNELACVGSMQSAQLPLDVYIAGIEMEGLTTMVTQGQVLYLNGPKVSSLKAGTIQRVVRPEGKIRDSITGNQLGFYYKDVGTVRIETVEPDRAMATVVLACHGLIKGDVVISDAPKPAVEFKASPSNDLTVLPDNGLVGSILFAKDDAREMSAGEYCFVGLGGRDGFKTGDRLTIFRVQPPFDSKDMAITEMGGSDTAYPRMNNWAYHYELDWLLRNRKLPPKILGDVVIVDVKEGVSLVKIVNSLSEIHIGDFVVKR